MDDKPLHRLILFSSGNDAARLDRMEAGFRLHCEPRWEMQTHRLGMVDNLGLTYDQAARSHEDDDDILMFCHQDVRPFAVPGKERIANLPDNVVWLNDALHVSNGWLKTVEQLLQKPDTGLMGVAGANGLSKDNAWWQFPDVSGAVVHITDGKERLNPYGCWGRVAVLDGLCLLIRCGVYKKLRLPLLQQARFHFYDMDLSLRCLQVGLKNWTIPLLVQHESGGSTTKQEDWQSDHELFAAAWDNILPVREPFEPLPGDPSCPSD